MNSGIRIPYHFEVAETQRIAAQENLRLQAEFERAQAKTLPDATHPPQSLLVDAAAEPTPIASTVMMDAASRTAADAKKTRLHHSEQQSSLVPAPAASATAAGTAPAHFVPTPTNPPSLGAYETLRNMPEVPRYDAFYTAPLVPLQPFQFHARWRYLSWFREDVIKLDDFLSVDDDQATAIARIYRHPSSGTQVTLLPVAHVAHPLFWQQADELCAQHHSVLMEGRFSPTSSDISVVPPREKYKENRPEEELDAEGWEPPTDGQFTNFRQPYGWGVRDSPVHTVVHAADCYDYDRLPVWARLRFNWPVIGNYRREKHCLGILHQLTENGYESFIIPWGAIHAPIFAKMLMQNGFMPAGSTRLPLFNRVDGPISAAYCRKLKSSVGWYQWMNIGARTTAVLTACYIGVLYFAMDLSSVVDWTAQNEVGRDASRRRAWDRAMQPTSAQNKLRQM